jgi:hypothetical protein
MSHPSTLDPNPSCGRCKTRTSQDAHNTHSAAWSQASSFPTGPSSQGTLACTLFHAAHTGYSLSFPAGLRSRTPDSPLEWSRSRSDSGPATTHTPTRELPSATQIQLRARDHLPKPFKPNMVSKQRLRRHVLRQQVRGQRAGGQWYRGVAHRC